MKCEICGKEILRDSQCINYKYYHNDCIENLQEENKKLNGSIQTYYILLKANIEENKRLKDNWNKIKEFIKSQNDGGIFSDLMIISDVLNKMQELERKNKV